MLLDGSQRPLERGVPGPSEDCEARVEQEGVECGGEDVESVSEPLTVYGDGEVEEGVLCLVPVEHVGDEAFLAAWGWP